MSLRLGEVLIQKNLINEAQLKQALDAQLIYGGHLGTCLVELGFVDVDRLGQVLAERFKVSSPNRERILKIDAKVVGTLSTKLVAKHEVIPFDLKNRILHVAMIDPKNLLALDELSFASGFKIEAWIAPEILILRAMEHYYGIPRRLRHITLSGQLGKQQAAGKAKTKAQAAPPESVASAEPAPPPEAAPPPQAPPAIEARPEPEPVPVPKPDPEPMQEAVPDLSAPEIEPPPVTGVEDGFVAQTDSPIHQQAARESGPELRDGKLSVEWIKKKKEGDERWCDLFSLPLEHDHFNGLEGVYVIWHNGRNPVLRIGQGYVRTELSTLKLDRRIISTHAESALFVTWARIPRAHRDGVERYLIDMLNPQIVTETVETSPVEVNLPR
jgi:hypothetical protein